MTRVVRATIRGGGTDPLAWFQGKVRAIEKGGQDALDDSMKDGEDAMKSYISTRGTAKSGKRGRIESGQMLDAVHSSVVSTGVGSATGKFGWIENTEPYFGYQDVGFQHVNGGSVEGMNALVDAAEHSWQVFQEKFEQVIKNA